MPVSEPVLTPPGAGEAVSYGSGSTASIEVAGEQSGGEYSAVRWTVRRGDEPPIHTHSREDELVYVLSGNVTAFVGDAEVEVGAGAYAALPRGVPHGIRVEGDEAELLITLVPAGLERFFVPADDSDGDPGKFGLEIVGDVPR